MYSGVFVIVNAPIRKYGAQHGCGASQQTTNPPNVIIFEAFNVVRRVLLIIELVILAIHVWQTLENRTLSVSDKIQKISGHMQLFGLQFDVDF